MPISFGFSKTNIFNKKKGGISSPTQIANLRAWYKADAGTRKGSNVSATSDGDLLNGWQDQSGNNLHLGLGYAASSPVLKTGANGLNGLPGIYMGGNSAFFGYAPLFTNAFTEIVLFKPASSTARMWISNAGHTPDYGGFQLAIEQASNILRLYVGAAAYSTTVAASTNPQIVSFSMNITTGADVVSNTIYRVNKSTAALTGTGTFPDYTGKTTNFWIGSGSAKLFAMTGHVYEYIFYNRKLSEAEMLDVENYLSSKWGI